MIIMEKKLKNGVLLFLNYPSKPFLQSMLKEASKYINANLYVDFLTSSAVKHSELAVRSAYEEIIATIYNRPRNSLKQLDVHVLLPPASSVQDVSRRQISLPLNMCITSETVRNSITDFEVFVQKRYKFTDFVAQYTDNVDNEEFSANFNSVKKTFPGVVIGGTFDQIHDGHRMLISTALLLAEEKITVGIADKSLLDTKLLKELIAPINQRIENVVQMIEDYKPGLKHKVVALHDPCGPSGTDDDIQCLVVSDETLKGGAVVNQTRNSNGLEPLEIVRIDLVGDEPVDLSETLNDEGKLSSSAERVRRLGTLRKEPNLKKDKGKCYVIGMTGGIASGKSSVVKRIEKLGAFVIDCDKLGHQAYLPDRPAYDAIVDYFGTSILNEKKEIMRRQLGSIVFSDPKKLQKLNEIVWPEIRRMRQDIITQVELEGKHDIVVFEGAVLFESGWDKDAHEVWCCVIPDGEAIRRVMERNGLTEEEAKTRLSSQLSNKERVDRSHVILSTLWEPEFTQKQVEKAWKLLLDRIDSNVKKQSLL